jgi:hypothetical protein
VNTRQVRLMRAINDSVAALQDPRFHTATIKPLRADLERLARTLRGQMSTQLSAGISVSADGWSISQLKSELRRKHLLPIARRAKLLLKGYPGIEESLRVPHARADAAKHVDATKRIVKALRPHAAEFHAAGFRKTFLGDCEQVARALAARNANPDTARSRRAIATRSIPETIRDAREIIAVIDAHVNAELGDNRPLMAKWRMSKRVPARMGRPRKRPAAK